MLDHNNSQRESVKIVRGRQFYGDFQLPGDKSISHRSAMFAALGMGPARLRNYSSARDCQNTLDCLEALGVELSRSPEEIRIEGVGLHGLRRATLMLDVGNSGTTLRLLSGILAGQAFPTEITGDESIQRRPMKRIIEPMRLMGARVDARDGNFAPLRIEGGELRAIDYEPPVASAQVKSCVLLAGLYANGKTTLIEKTPTRNHTEVMLRECGVVIEEEGDRISIQGGQSLRALGDYTVAGDLSSAAFFMVGALISPAGEICLRHIGINPSRTALIAVLHQLGGRIEIRNSRFAHGEPVADIVASSSELQGDLELSGAVIANLIDEIPILAVAATRMKGSLTIREAGELRVKESDRIRAIVDNLRAFGVVVDEYEDGFKINGPQQPKGARIDSFGDHRIAMAFAIAGSIADGETELINADAASVSLPEFYSLTETCGVPFVK